MAMELGISFEVGYSNIISNHSNIISPSLNLRKVYKVELMAVSLIITFLD